MRNSFQIWINAVCEQVRFRPDHRSIEFELRDHYEEHVRDLIRLGRPRELAEERALEAMGNAQEVGRALDKVHKPWLGWIWEVSRFLVLALALLLAWKIWNPDSYTRSLADRTWDQLTWSVPSSASRGTMDYLSLWLASGEPEPYCEPYTDIPLPDESRLQVPLILWVETQDVFHDNLEGLYQRLEITADGQSLPWGRYTGDGETPLESGYWLNGPAKRGWTRCCDQIVLVLDGPPQRVEVTHPRGNWTLTAEWEGMS